MKFSREEVLEIVISALKEGQEAFPEDIIEITEDTKPIGELAHFDSLTSVVVTVRCLDALGCNEELSLPSLFIDKKGNYLSVGQVAEQLLQILKKK